MAKLTLGSVFVTRVDEVEPLIQYTAGHIGIGDAVHHPLEGPCTVLARLGEHLMVEAERRLAPAFSSRSG
ncbi:MAG TPA: hypothetical protein VFA75_20970 [Nevskia sp.]|jgi:hypothetical protein|nr:hypothetical protein [Nevskia sp.]